MIRLDEIREKALKDLQRYEALMLNLATAKIYDRTGAIVDAGVLNAPFAEYKTLDDYPADSYLLCRTGMPVTAF